MMSRRKPSPLEIPPTRTHHDLARWINTNRVIDGNGKIVLAVAQRSWSSTDRDIRGTRLRRPGKGRRGLKLSLYLPELGWDPGSLYFQKACIYEHDTSQTYRMHWEAREWVSCNLRRV